jgi:flagellar hook-length control protein FliK
MTSTASVLPPALRDLVGEIHVHAGGAGPTEIEIQFTSQTLEGLRVNIKREEGVVSIQFSTSSESTSRLLAQHMPQLSKTLTSRDIPAVISIRVARDSSLERRSGEAGGRSRKRQ